MSASMVQACNHMKQKGIVLVSVIWVLAVLALATAVMAKWVESAINQVEQRWVDVDELLKHDAMSQRLTLLMLTQRYTTAGLTTPGSPQQVDSDMGVMTIQAVGGEMPLDGAVTKLGNGWSISLLDERAKFSLTNYKLEQLQRFLTTFGVSENEAYKMSAQLKDYTDRNDRPLAGGGEAPFYRQRGLAPPPNRPLRTIMELFRVPSWKPWQSRLLSQGWMEKVTVRVGRLNINTVLPEVIQARWKLSDSTLRTFVTSRREHKITSDAGLEKALGRFIPTGVTREDWYRLADNKMNLTVWSPEATYGQHYLIDFGFILAEKTSGHYQRPAKPLQLLWQRRIQQDPKSEVTSEATSEPTNEPSANTEFGVMEKSEAVTISFLSAPIMATARP